MLKIVIGAIIQFVDLFMGLFRFGSWAEKRNAENSLVGESKLDQEARSWQERIWQSWWSIYIILLLLLGGAAAVIWHFLTTQ